ncbi:MAG: hypothetical protein HY718_13135, partial [Planctomycetes bacterium]|nr:hypothetical protein [Planctomycetota bacterium]
MNQWEVRLLDNALIGISVRVFGYHEWAAALPPLCASLTILLTVLAACRKLGTVGQAWWAGLVAAVLPVEVTNATIISAHAVMAGFMAPGTLAFVLAPESTRARRVAAVCLPLG